VVGSASFEECSEQASKIVIDHDRVLVTSRRGFGVVLTWDDDRPKIAGVTMLPWSADKGESVLRMSERTIFVYQAGAVESFRLLNRPVNGLLRNYFQSRPEH